MDTIDITTIDCNIENADDIYKYTNYSLVDDFILPVCHDIELFDKPINIGNNVNIYLDVATIINDIDLRGGSLDIFIQVKSEDRERADILEQNERAKQLVIQRLHELVNALNTSQLNIEIPIDHLDSCIYKDSANAFFNKLGEPTPTTMKPRFMYEEDEADRLFTYIL